MGFGFLISFAFLFILYGFIYLPSVLKQEYREETCIRLDYLAFVDVEMFLIKHGEAITH